jgi:hypothetical protein
MAEPPASWEQQDDDNTTLSSTTFKLGGLNVNATEFVPTFGSGFSLAPKAPIVSQPTTAPKTPPSTPVVPRHTTDEENKQTEPIIKADEVNIEQQVKEPITTAGERDFDDFPDEENESECSLIISCKYLNVNSIQN